MQRTAVRLSAATFEIVWQYMGLGDLPTALFVAPTGATVEERRAAERAGGEELRRLGLIVNGDQLTDEATGLFQVLHRPVDEFYGWFVRSDNSVFSGLAAVRDQRAALAVLDGGEVWLSAIGPDSPAQALVGLAPRVAPARGASISVPADDFYLPSAVPAGRARRAEDPDGEGESVLRGGPAPTGHDLDVAKLRALVAEPSSGRGQLFVANRDQSGRRRKSTRPIYYFDAEAGRWLLHFSAARGEQPWLTAVSGTPENLTRALYDTHRALLAGARP